MMVGKWTRSIGPMSRLQREDGVLSWGWTVRKKGAGWWVWGDVSASLSLHCETLMFIESLYSANNSHAIRP